MSYANHYLNLYTPAQVREFDRVAIEEHNIPAIVLMKRAGRAAFDVLQAYWPEISEVHVFCGSGNNGGDGYVIAALAARSGLQASVWQLNPPKTPAAQQACAYAEQEGAQIKPFILAAWQTIQAQISPLAVVVDALLGIGFEGELSPEYRDAIQAINTVGLPVLAADIPSGIYGETGACDDIAVNATVTVSFIAQKLGNKIGQGLVHAGRQHLAELDVPAAVFDGAVPAAQLLELNEALASLPPRAVDAHKGDCGHVLVVGGDHGFGGAVAMSAQMAARSGAGLVGVATQAPNTAPIITRQPEIMAASVASGLELSPLLEKPSVLVLGPGLGQSAWSEQLLLHSLAAGKKMVLDADALNLLAQGELVLPQQGKAQAQWVMTPHPGEAARLLGQTIAKVQADRIAAAKALQKNYGGCVVLKGAGTIIVTPAQEIFICDAGNSGMASGGMGDVLAGLLGGLIAQKMSITTATCLGVLLHSHAADVAVEEHGQRGLLATDLIPVVTQCLKDAEQC